MALSVTTVTLTITSRMMFLSEQLYSLTINLPLLPPVSSKFCPPKYTSNTFNTLTQCLILPCIKLGFSLHGEGGVGLTEF
ncbi:MAG: hypothetical protein ACI936_000302 [Paraglaciecola sp.]|jgi:hypothetical protein